MLRIRDMNRADIPSIVRYFTAMSAEDCARMGVERARVPPADVLSQSLAEYLECPPERASACYLIWMLGDGAVGHSSLKDIRFGESATQHLHLWQPKERAKGHGAAFFCLSAVEFYRRFRLKQILCEPKSTNPAPNRMLRKAGFPLIGTRVARSSEVSELCELNSYLIDLEIAEGYLRRFQGVAGPEPVTGDPR